FRTRWHDIGHLGQCSWVCGDSQVNYVVQKYGGSSVATPELIQRVAKRIAEARAVCDGLVVVVSAMGDTTDDLLALARQITDDASAREMDMLLSAGETI